MVGIPTSPIIEFLVSLAVHKPSLIEVGEHARKILIGGIRGETVRIYAVAQDIGHVDVRCAIIIGMADGNTHAPLQLRDFLGHVEHVVLDMHISPSVGGTDIGLRLFLVEDDELDRLLSKVCLFVVDEDICLADKETYLVITAYQVKRIGVSARYIGRVGIPIIAYLSILEVDLLPLPQSIDFRGKGNVTVLGDEDRIVVAVIRTSVYREVDSVGCIVRASRNPFLPLTIGVWVVDVLVGIFGIVGFLQAPNIELVGITDEDSPSYI